MSQLFQKSKDIRYTKLYFTIQFTEDTHAAKAKSFCDSRWDW